MLMLIRRELDSLFTFLVLEVTMAAMLIAFIISSVMYKQMANTPVGIPTVMISTLWLLIFLLPFLSGSIGASQMYWDRDKKISTFLCTLATTRNRILAARIIAGMLVMSVVPICLAVTDAMLLKVYPRLVPIEAGVFARMFLITLLINLACYAMGLQMGWSQNKYLPSLGELAVCVIVVSVIVLTGLSVHSMVILGFVAVGSFVRAWQKFMSTSL